MSEKQEAEGATGPISTTIEAPHSWQRVVKVEIARDYFDREFSMRLKKATKHHQRPGFRKGRTPRAVVEKELGDRLRMDAIEALVPRAWMTSVLEHKLSPVTEPELGNLTFAEDEPLKFDLTVEVRPEITLDDIDGITVKRSAVVVADEDVSEVLKSLQESRATWAKVDRAGQTGDQITLDLTPGPIPGQDVAGEVIRGQKFILGAESNMKIFNEELMGLAAGAVKELEVEYPADHPNTTLKGQMVTFKCEINEIAAKELPALDDAFAAEVSGGKTLAELKAGVRENLTDEAEDRRARDMDAQIRAELTRRHDVEVPPSMVDKYLASGLEEMHQRNTQLGRPGSTDEDQEYLKAGRPHAEQALAGMLLLEAVRAQEGIKVSTEDVDERIDEIAAENGFDVEKYREFVNGGQEKENMEFSLLERKTYDFLLSRAEIEDVAAGQDVGAAE